MPELPEVEQLSRGIRRAVLGATFVNVAFHRDDIREKLDKTGIQRIVLNQPILQVTRRGKYMLLHTETGAVCIHLGMSGKFLIDSVHEATRPHTHVVFTVVTDGGQTKHLHFVDPRRFGRVFPISSQELEKSEHPFLRHLGVEPLEENVDLATHLFTASRRRNAPIKSFLMDSSVVVGVGNIYASESLWAAKISPLRPAASIKRVEMQRLAQQIIETLRVAVEAGGTTFRDYRDSTDNPGGNQANLAVYEREAKPCKRCRRFIFKITQAGRSTYYCSFCQK